MSDTQITLEFLANTDGLKAAAQQMQLLGNISKEQYAQFIKLGAENEKMLKQQAAAQKLLSATAQNTAGSAKLLNDNFRQFNQTIVQGNLNIVIQQFSQVTTQISAIGKQTADTTEKVKKMADTKPLNQLVEGLKEVTKVLSTAKEVAASMGTETTGLQAAITDLQTATDVMSKVQDGYNALMEKNGLFTKAASAIQSVYTTVVGTSTGALKVFRIALASTGILAAVAVLAELVLNWDKYRKLITGTGDELVKLSPKQAQHNQLIAAANQQAGKEIATMQVLRNTMLNEQLPRKERLKALTQFNLAAADGNKIMVSEMDNRSRINQQIQKQTDLILALATVKAAEELITKKVSEKLQLEAKQREESYIKQQKAIESHKKLIGLDKTDESGSMTHVANTNIANAEMEVIVHKNASDEIIKNKQNEIDILLTLIDEYQDKYKKTLLDTSATQPATNTTSFNEENARSFAAANQKWIAEQKEGIQELIDAEEERRLHLQQGSDEEVAAYKNVIELKKQMAELDYGFTQPEKLKLTLTQLEDEYQTYYGNVLQGRMQSNQKGLDELKLNHDLQLKLQQDFGLTQQQVDDDYAASGFATFKEYEEKKRAELQNTADKMAENQKLLAQAESAMQQFMFDSIQQLSDAAFDNMKEARDQQLTTTLESMEKQKQLELSNKNLTEQQKKDIEDKYRRMEAEAKKKAWKADQQAKAEQALINGFLAFTMSLAQQGVPAGLITGAIALATAGVQAGIILSKPVPQFARGGKNIPAGMKLVGEEGPELLWTPGGETVIPHGDTAKILQAWSIPVPHVNPALKTDMAIAAALPAGIDYNKLAVVLAQELRNNPSVNISMDNAGFAMHLLQRNKTVQLLNNRYSA